MSSSYLPLQTIHAHLPAPPSIPNSIPEIRVVTERTFPTTAELSQGSLHLEHAASTSYDPSTGILARSIHNGYVLELRTLSTSKTKERSTSGPGSDIRRIYLPDPLLPLSSSCIIPSKRDGKVYILVITSAFVVYRLSFPLGDFLPASGQRVSFSTQSSWCEEYQIDDQVIPIIGVIGSWTAVNENSLFLGSSDGGLAWLDRDSSNGSVNWTASHHRPANKFRLTSFFGRSGSAEQIISTAHFQASSESNTAIYTFSRDRKLRSWSAANGTCLKSVDVRTSSSGSQEVVIRSPTTPTFSGASSSTVSDVLSAAYIQVLPHPSTTPKYTHLVIVFSPSSSGSENAGFFVVYRANASNDLVYAGEKHCSMLSAGADMRSFEILPPFVRDNISIGWRLLVVWDKNGTPMCETVIMDDIFQFTTFVAPTNPIPLLMDWQLISSNEDIEQYDAAYFDDLIPLEIPETTDPNDTSDIISTFINHLFHPGRFSMNTLQTALEDYIQDLTQQGMFAQIHVPYPSLSKRFAGIIGCDLEMQMDPQTGAPMVEVLRSQLKRDWLGVWSRVRDLDKQARYPLGTCLVDSQPVVMNREGVTAIIPEDAASLAVRLGKSPEDAHAFRQLSPQSLWTAQSPRQQVSRGTTAITTAGSTLSSILESQDTEDGAPALDALTADLAVLTASSPTEPLETSITQIWNDLVDPYLTEEDRTAIRRTLSECHDLEQGLFTALELVSDLDLSLPGVPITDLSFSGIGDALLSSAIKAIVSARYQLALSVLLVTLFHISEYPSFSAAEDDNQELLSLLASALFTFHRLSVLKWLSEQTAEESIEKTSKTTRRSKRKFEEDEVMYIEGQYPLESETYDSSYSLLHSLLSKKYKQSPTRGSPSSIYDTSITILADFEILSSTQIELQADTSDLQLACSVLMDGHPRLAGTFAALYPPGASLAYIKGRAYALLGDIEEATRSFEQAVSGCKHDSFAVIVPSISGVNAATEYYRHITNVFADLNQNEPVVHFGTLAIQTAKAHDLPTKDLWTRVFLANIAMELYEEAYSNLIDTPYMDLREDFLGQLISVMCEHNQVGRLNSLGFVGLQDRVEKLLSFKARNSDPLRFPNYYKVLYSWHISRSDYRSAGEIMYKQARRFAYTPNSKISAFELAAMQGRSYLAAINALCMVDKRNAWVAVPAPLQSSEIRAKKQRKLSTYIPEEEFVKEKHQIDIVSLADIRAEYALVLAQLQLSNHMEDLHRHGITTSPEEVIGLMIQNDMFDQALSTAVTLGVDMSDIFKALAARSVELFRMSEMTRDVPKASYLSNSPLTTNLHGPPAALALRYLQSSLSRHDTAKTNYRYRQVVSEVLFEMNQDKRSGWQMPQWLVDWEMARNPESWINTAVRYGWVEEALDWSITLLRNATPPELLPPRKDNVADIPYSLFDRVIAAAGEGDEKEEKNVQMKVKQLKEAVRRRIEGLKTVGR